jgi:hypothetical protein
MIDMRKQFEQWASEEPRCWDLCRNPSSERLTAWPNQYHDYAVQAAWEAWYEASKRVLIDTSEVG